MPQCLFFCLKLIRILDKSLALQVETFLAVHHDQAGLC